MTDYTLLRERFTEVARSVTLDEVPEIEAYHWPEKTMRALAEAGLFGLAVPERYGGLGMGLTGLTIAGEVLGRISGSAALCFCMHVVGSAVLAAKATDDQVERYLVPIAQGKHLTTLALSEPETGIHFYEPATKLDRKEDSFLISGTKTFVTNGSKADSYVISTLTEHGATPLGMFNCLVIDQDTPGLHWEGEWRGLGMRGNSSIAMHLDEARVPIANLIGEEGEQTWYIFNVVAPYFLMAMSATYLGVAESALDFSLAHVKERSHAHTRSTLAEVPAIQAKITDMWTRVQQLRLHLYHAAERGDLGAPDALAFILSAKMVAAEAAVDVTNEAMTCVGGMGYRENSMLWTLLQDARASHIMGPSTDLLRTWTARTLLDLPVLG